MSKLFAAMDTTGRKEATLTRVAPRCCFREKFRRFSKKSVVADGKEDVVGAGTPVLESVQEFLISEKPGTDDPSPEEELQELGAPKSFGEEAERVCARLQELVKPRETQSFHGEDGKRGCAQHESAETQNFKDCVIKKDPKRNELFSPNTEHIVRSFNQIDVLSECHLERQKELLRAYTEDGPLYRTVNSALRKDSLAEMRFLAAYIKELRDVFLWHPEPERRILKPYVGLAWRGIQVDNVDHELAKYTKDQCFCWNAFTSLTSNRRKAGSFGNITFEIRCDNFINSELPGGSFYFPACISEYSAFPDEHEVIFPPFAEFQVLNVVPAVPGGMFSRPRNPVVQCRMPL